MKLNKDRFQNLSNKERAEIYANIVLHNETYLEDGFSIRNRIHQQRFDSIMTLMGDTTEKTVLDAGCGEGYFLSRINAKRKIGIEISENRLRRAQKLLPGVDIESADVTNLPFNDNSFDIIICSEVLEHVNGYQKAIMEFKRCIRSNGYIILSFPNELTVSLGRLLILRFPLHEMDHVNSIKPSDIEKLLGKKYKSLNVPRISYPFCLYQVYRFDVKDFK